MDRGDRLKLLICTIATYGTMLLIIGIAMYTLNADYPATFAERFHFK